MMSLALLAVPLALPFAPQEPIARAGTWDALADEYELATIAWLQEVTRIEAWNAPADEQPVPTSVVFWPRFERLARAGNGWALLWMLQNPHATR